MTDIRDSYSTWYISKIHDWGSLMIKKELFVVATSWNLHCLLSKEALSGLQTHPNITLRRMKGKI